MRDLIDRDAFLKQERKWYCDECDRRKGVKNGRKCFVYEIGEVPCRACEIDDVLDDLEVFESAAPRWVRCEEGCDLCRDDRLEKGDTLYQSSDWDGGIGFDYIIDIRFCPKCGRELTQWKPEPPKEDV